jgi:uncharacterized membrane protein (DUF106 family)
MILMIVYMLVGILIGVLIKCEVDNRNRKKRMQNRLAYLQSKAVQEDIQKYDSMLESLKSINDSLSMINNQK